MKAVELATGASKTLADWTIPSFYPAVSPDGNRVAYGDGNTLIVRDLRTGEEVRRITTTSTNSGCLPGWSADGKYVGFGGFGYAGGALTVLEVATGRHADVFRGPFTMPAWSPDGKRLAFDYRFGSELAIWTVGQSWVEGCLAGTIPTNAISRRKPPVSRAFPRPGFTPPVQTTNLVMKGILVPSLEHLRTNGAFGFPQSKAKILCDLPELRFSVTSNDKYLLAQAILWKDDNSTLGKTQDGRSVGDHSILMMNLGTNGVVTPNVDRIYSLNPWPELPGLHYQVLVRERAWTTLKSDSQGRGAIRQASIPNGRNVRVDTYVIPLTEISKQTGESIRLCYYGDSPAPKFSVDSAGFFEKTKDYYSHHIPRSAYHEYVLEKGLVPDISKFPEGRITGNKVAPTPNPKLNVKVGDTVDMEFTALDGRAIRLSQLKGKVVLVDFWATWCGPCMAELPKVLAAYQKLHDLGFEIIGISFDEDKAALERVLQQKGITWPQYFDGKFWKNEFGVKYGIDAIPSMWLIDRDGKVASTNARQDLVQQVEKLINSKPE